VACEKAAWRPDPRTGRAFPPHSKTGGSSWSAPGSFERHGALRRGSSRLGLAAPLRPERGNPARSSGYRPGKSRAPSVRALKGRPRVPGSIEPNGVTRMATIRGGCSAADGDAVNGDWVAPLGLGNILLCPLPGRCPGLELGCAVGAEWPASCVRELKVHRTPGFRSPHVDRYGKAGGPSAVVIRHSSFVIPPDCRTVANCPHPAAMSMPRRCRMVLGRSNSSTRIRWKFLAASG
jgi:hypothetical protein